MIGEDAPLPTDFKSSDAELLGSVRVNVFRARQWLLNSPNHQNGSYAKPIDEISERALKGKEIKNTVKYVLISSYRTNHGVNNILGSQLWSSSHLLHLSIMSTSQVRGQSGRTYEYNFLYRNRSMKRSVWRLCIVLILSGILQHLGCIPRSPSPPPDPTLMLHRTENMLELVKRKAKEHSLENARLRVSVLTSRRKSSSDIY